MNRVMDRTPAKTNRAWAALFLALLAGTVLLLHFGGRFVFYYEEAYISIALWSSVVIMPLMSSFVVALAWMAPLGWLLAAACWAGGATQHVRAVAVKVDAPASNKGCDRHATLRFARVEKKTCIDGMHAATAMQQGEVLDVGIRAFPFGFLIDSIAPMNAGRRDDGVGTGMPI